jgi:hypothetical protein
MASGILAYRIIPCAPRLSCPTSRVVLKVARTLLLLLLLLLLTLLRLVLLLALFLILFITLFGPDPTGLRAPLLPHQASVFVLLYW